MTRNKTYSPAVRRGQGGFTLVEIMLVVLLIGIAVTFVNLNLDPDPAQVVRREGDRVAVLLRQLADESVLRGRAMAMHVDTGARRYRFEVLEGSEWKSLADDELFYERRFRQPVTATLSVDSDPGRATRAGDENEEADGDRADGRARVVVDPVGEVTPFRLALSAADHQVVVALDEFANVVATPAGESR